MFWFYIAMIGMVSNKNTNFGRKPLHSVNLKNADAGFVKAVVSELEPSVDVGIVDKLNQQWGGTKLLHLMDNYFSGRKKYAGSNHLLFCQKKFPPISKFFAVELDDEKPLHQKIVGVFQTVYENYFNAKNIDLAYLQVKPDFMHKADTAREITGVGEISLGKTMKLAKDLECSTLSIESDNDDFYFKTFGDADVKVWDNREYDYSRNIYIKSDGFEKYLEYIARKYHSKF